jgi:predicted nucleic acid-binding protein
LAALYYLETSALVKLYVREPGTDRLLWLTRPELNHRFALLAIAPVEFRSAIRRRQRAGDIEKRVAVEIINRFTQHIETMFIQQALSEAVLDTASGLIDRYPLRAYDAVQLAGCLVLKAMSGKEGPIFVCSDHPLLEAAESERLPLLDPTTPQETE